MREKIIEIVRNACALDEEVNEDSELKTLSLDSLSFVGAIVELESVFNIAFDMDELNVASWTTVKDIIQAVEEKTNA